MTNAKRRRHSMNLTERFCNARLVPMSREQLRLEGKKNSRHGSLRQLWFVDGIGTSHLLITREIELLGLAVKWPWYMKVNWGIRRINQGRELINEAA